ncbi:IMPACT family protein [Fusobacterium sp.]|uniref:IMPACT family protein n=1 Tax=Fusobacterium sp. TaxID=68766 RepID=UPI00396CD3B0
MNTIKKEAVIEFEERKSRFIGYAKPVSSKKEAEDFIESIKQKHPDATHNCSAYQVIDDGQEYFKTDDDGEPGGTAGKPMGDIITYMEVSNLAVVATRYFGGIKLGAGGLVRNYAKTAKLAIQEAEIEKYVEKKVYILDFPYEKIGEVENTVGESGEYIEKGYNDRVTYKIKTDTETYEKFKNIKDVIIVDL